MLEMKRRNESFTIKTSNTVIIPCAGGHSGVQKGLLKNTSISQTSARYRGIRENEVPVMMEPATQTLGIHRQQQPITGSQGTPHCQGEE